jgi:hypothetical protein
LVVPSSSTIRAQLEEFDYVAAQRLYRRRTVWWPIAGFVGAAVLIGVVVQAHRAQDTLAFCVSLGALAGGVIGGFACHYIWIPWQARRVFRQQKSLHRPFELSWDSNGLHAKDANGEYRHLWSDILRWREGERLFVLNLSDAMFLMIPKRAFPEEQSLSAFRDLVRARVAD